MHKPVLRPVINPNRLTLVGKYCSHINKSVDSNNVVKIVAKTIGL